MVKEDFLKSNTFKILMVMVIVLSIIKLFEAGFLTGKWLQTVSH